jgi:hypothetical protein
MARGTNPRPRKSNTKVLLIALVAVIGGIAIIASLVATGVLKLPFMEKPALAAESNKSSDHKGQIPIPIAARSIQVFSAVQREDLFDSQTRSVKISWVDPEAAKKQGFITQYPEVIGRVLNHDKAVGYAFTEADFYPKGAQPTPANAVERNMRGLYVDASRIDGLAALKRDDHFDLIAVKQTPGGQSAGTSTSYGNASIARSESDRRAWNTTSRALVQNGKVIMALPAASAGKAKAGDQMYIQISPDEFVGLQDALALGAHISCATRPAIGTEATKPLPDPGAPVPTDTIEVLSGSKSRNYQIPASKPSEDASNTDGDSNGAKPNSTNDPEPKKKSAPTRE